MSAPDSTSGHTAAASGSTTDGPAPTYKGINGWLLDPAAEYTAFLVAHAPALRDRPAVEIGVYFGKYFSVVADATAARLVGYDIFMHGPNHYQRVTASFDKLYPGRDIAFVKGSSRALTPETLRADMRAEHCGVFSIDGSHHLEDVMHDLSLADAVLADDGFVAYDDFLNPNCMGVNEAFFRYAFKVDGASMNLVPFAYVTNKLFLCRPERYETYHGLSVPFLEASAAQPWIKKLDDQRARDIQPSVVLANSPILRVTM